jgi:hypothetical protein
MAYRYYEGRFNNFIKLIGNASLTFQRIERQTSEDPSQYKDELKFNFTNTLIDYRNSLYRELDGLKKEIMNDVIQQISRFEKLVYISNKVVELQKSINCLSKGKAGYSHINFVFSNISKGEGKGIQKSEADIQDFYIFMNDYSNDAINFMKIVEESVNKSSSNDFPELKPLLPDPNASTPLKPIAFYEFFFVSRGFTKFHKNFYPATDEDYYNISSVDEKLEIITYEDYDTENGEPYSYKKEFKEVLLNSLYKEFIRTKKFIDEHIDSLHTEIDIKLYLKLFLYRLKYIYMILQKYEEAAKYESCDLVLKAIIRYVFEKYEPFVNDHVSNDFFKKIITPDYENKNILIPTVTSKMLPQREIVFSFKWTKFPAERTTKLHRRLVDAGFISQDIELILFSKAFDGSPLDEPLNIRWLKKIKGKLSKPLILYLFDQLVEKKLIEPTISNQEMYRKVQRVFTDHEGQPLQHFDVSSAQIKKRKSDYTQPEREIGLILSDLQ